MSEKIKVAAVGDIPPGERLVVEAGGKQIAVFNVNGQLVACDNTCLHRGGPLGEGDIEEFLVTCPWHGWQYDLSTGECLMNPKAKIPLYTVTVEGDSIWVEV
ncbi:MAG: Rieske 2Fe-2S domain-containing protein [candidate division Zixibacteria bacterium]|nr:Rieske 2Fe-2S domain-containing protein [candidate division Zixibacteria bacterium]